MISSFEDLIFCTRCASAILIWLAISWVILKLWRSRNLRGVKAVIELDGASCLVAEDGEIIIRRTTFRSLIYLAILGGSIVFVVYLIADVTLTRMDFIYENHGNVFKMIIPIILLCFPLVRLMQTLTFPSVRIIPKEKQLVIRNRAEDLRIPFAHVHRVQFPSSTSTYLNVRVSYISMVYGADESTRKLGSISGTVASVDKKIQKLGQLIADTMGLRYSEVDALSGDHVFVSPATESWIQSADCSLKTYVLNDAYEAIRVYLARDWARDRSLYNEMLAARQDCCPPGIGLCKKGGRFLHICPDGVAQISIYFRPADAPGATVSAYTDLPESYALVAIKAFYSGDDAWFKANTSYDSG